MSGKTGRKECSLCPFTGSAAARSPGKAGDHQALRAASGRITTNGMQAPVLPIHTDWNQAMLWTAVPWTELQVAVPEVCRSPGGHPGILLHRCSGGAMTGARAQPAAPPLHGVRQAGTRDRVTLRQLQKDFINGSLNTPIFRVYPHLKYFLLKSLQIGFCTNPPDWFKLYLKELNPFDPRNGFIRPSQEKGTKQQQNFPRYVREI